MADNDQAYKDDVAPDGSPFRPLYDDKIMFNGQPIALVVAETSEIARFAASLVRVEYEQEAACHGHLSRSATRPSPVKAPTNPIEALFAPPKTRGTPDQALAAAAVRHEAEYFVPIEHHNPMELYASTVVFEADGKLTVYDKTQGVQNVQQLSLRRVRHEAGGCARHVAVHGRRLRLGPAPAVPGGAGGARGARAAALGAGRADAAADVCAGLPAGDDPAHRARRKRRRNARCDHARCGHRDLAIRGLPSAGDRLVRPALQVAPMRNTRTGSRGSISPTSCDMRAPSAATARLCARIARWTSLRSRSSSIRSSFACAAIRTATRTRTGRTAARRCANATARAPRRSAGSKRNPEPRSMRDGSDLVGWGMATGVWEALQVPITVRIVLDRQRPCRGGVRDLRHRHRHLHHHGAGRGRHARAAARQHQHQARRLEPAAIAGRRRIVDCDLGGERDRDDGRRDPRRAAAPGQADAEFAARERRARRCRARRTASW